jgi:hypothetical protein
MSRLHEGWKLGPVKWLSLSLVRVVGKAEFIDAVAATLLLGRTEARAVLKPVEAKYMKLEPKMRKKKKERNIVGMRKGWVQKF